MKKNSQQVLLSLYYKQPPVPQIAEQVMYSLFPSLTQSGQRSLLHHLEKEGYVRAHQIEANRFFSITEAGRSAVVAHFPVFSQEMDTWQGEWSILLFLKSSSSDPQFRNLRRILLKEHSYQIKRGVYVTPAKFSTNTLSLCETLYRNSVVIGTVSSWDFGFELQSVFKDLALFDINQVYSGISGEVNSLLRLFLQNKTPSEIEKKQLISVFYRYSDNLSQDPGFLRYYFPKLIDPYVLLGRFQQLFSLVER